MKKLISVLMALILIISAFAGCAKQKDITSDIVLITNAGSVRDNGYNRDVWEGITSFAGENSMKCTYFQPMLDDGKITVENVEKYVAVAAEKQAQFVVFPGEDFAVCAYEIAPRYPDIKFILLDAVPHSSDDNTDRFIANVMCVSFDALQSGFIAGYTAVMAGNTKLGYFGENNNKSSANYGAGFVQGAAYAADFLKTPVTLDWAEYDSVFNSYDYGIKLTAEYIPVEQCEEETFTVKVVGGSGSGTYSQGSNVTITADTASPGQVFDHWEVKSDTPSVKDKKVNISSKTKSPMNLLVEKCDCTITAVYKDIDGGDGNYSNVTVMQNDGVTVGEVFSVVNGSSARVTAPVAQGNTVFDHWECEQDIDVKSMLDKAIDIKNVSSDITLVPVYKSSETPVFTVTVATGEGGSGESLGSGSYQCGDTVTVSAAPAQDGYMFSHWESEDCTGANAGISLDNEYYWSTSFEMTDRYAGICESMFNSGVNTIFTGCNSKTSSAFTAKGEYDYDLNIITAGERNNDSYFTVVKDYGVAVANALADFKGGSVAVADLSAAAIHSTFDFGDDNAQLEQDYGSLTEDLAGGKINLVHAQTGQGIVFCSYFKNEKLSDYLTLNPWFVTEDIALLVNV